MLRMRRNNRYSRKLSNHLRNLRCRKDRRSKLKRHLLRHKQKHQKKRQKKNPQKHK